MFSESNEDIIKWSMDSQSYKELIIKREGGSRLTPCRQHDGLSKMNLGQVC